MGYLFYFLCDKSRAQACLQGTGETFSRGERLNATGYHFGKSHHQLPYGLSIEQGFEQTMNKVLTLLIGPNRQGENEQRSDVFIAVYIDLLPVGP